VATLERRAVPTRSCVFCRTSREKRALLRVVRTPDGTMAFDPTGRANGRGAYVCRDEACIAGATGRGGLRRALESTVPADLADQLLTAAASGGGTDGTK
jgi:predicted RNA-binding protein YlxR (DUF448 family)